MMQEWTARTKMLMTHARRAPQNSSQHIVATFVARRRAVRNGAAQTTRVICRNAVSNVSGIGQRVGVWLGASRRLNGREKRSPQISFIIRALVLQYGNQSLQTHASIHVLGWQRREFPAIFAVELNEHQIPNFKHVGIAGVHQRRRVAATNAIKMNFTARTTRTGLAHFPKVVLHVARQHARRRKKFFPQRLGFRVRLKPGFFGTAKVGRI